MEVVKEGLNWMEGDEDGRKGRKKKKKNFEHIEGF